MDVKYKDVVLNLHDIALLLNYERGTTEPRFRHAKLREVASGPEPEFRTVLLSIPEWTAAECATTTTISKIGFVFDKPKGTTTTLSEEEENERDLPSNMLPKIVPPPLQSLTKKDLELYYWQVRNHDGCYRSIALFQHFIDLFPWDLTRILVQVVDRGNRPRTYTTLAISREIVEMELYQPKSMNVSCVVPDNQTYISGGDKVTIHAVLAFPRPTGEEETETILDLSSLQFGDVGRGYKGRGVFILEPRRDYIARLDTIAEGNNFTDAKRTSRIRTTPDDEFFKDVARRVKQRWEERETEPWCGHCGAPAPSDAPLKRCTKCRLTYYCDADHQLAAWPYHKHFCVDPKSPGYTRPMWL